MKAAVLYELGKPLRVVDGIEIPSVLHGQVAVRLNYSGVCHSQLMETRGARGPDRYLPHLLGHEGAGVVMETGPGVTKVKRGDRVVLGWIKASGLDVSGPRYRRGDETLSAGAITTFNEFAIVSENRCVPLPDGVPMDVAVLFGCALPTGAGIVTNSLKPAAGSTVAVFGLGGIGMSAMMACRLHDCGQLIAIDVSAEKLALGARRLVPPPLLTPRAPTLSRKYGDSPTAKGPTTPWRPPAPAGTIEQAFNSVRRGGGLCIFASHPPHSARISIDPYELICGKRIVGSWGGGSDPDRDIPRFAALYLAGQLPLEKLITQRYRLDDINAALDDLEQHRVGRPVIEIDP